MSRLTQLLTKKKETWLYLLFGGFTTVVDYVAALVCFHIFGFGEITSNNIAWLLAVAFAYVTSKLVVFESKSFAPGVLLREIGTFLLSRIISLVISDVIIYMLARCGISFLAAKVISSVFVIVINYIFSKRIIFKTERKKENE
jgi:putative flippase GtrA